VQRYASVDASLYRAILNRCVEANKMCMDDMMAIDAKAAWANRAASTWRSPADADRAGFHHRSWPQVRCVHVQRHPGNRLSRRELEQILMNDTFDLTKFIFGRLSWGIDSLYDPDHHGDTCCCPGRPWAGFGHDLLQRLGHAVA
jgi:hypothetical protein